MSRGPEETKFKVGDDVVVGTYQWRGTVTKMFIRAELGCTMSKALALELGSSTIN